MKSQPVFKIVKGIDLEFSIKESLRVLKIRHGAACVKLSTEDAGMSLEQIGFWAEICEGVLPVIVKIGGPYARNDIKQLIEMGVDGLLAPMVESPYGLENFIEGVRDFTTPMQFNRLKKSINVETETAVKQLDKILASPDCRFIDEITIGCSDLSRSLKKNRHDKTVFNCVKKTVEKIKTRGIGVSVGGGVTPDSIDEFLKKVQPDKFNTRVVTFDVNLERDYRSIVEEALYFELLMLEHDSAAGFITRDEEKFRAAELKKRLPN